MLRPVGGLVRVRRAGGVAVVELHHPERRNAMSLELVRRLCSELASLAAASDVEALVITGAGGVFSSGADLSEDLGPGIPAARMRLYTEIFERVTAFPRPTVAAIAGPCIGAGAEMAAACDLRVAGATASFRFPGVHFGAPVGAARLALLVGLSHAKDLLMTARTIGSEEAYRMGLVNRLVADEALEATAIDLAAAMSANAGALVQKRAIDELTGLSVRVGRENRALRRWQAEVEVDGSGSSEGRKQEKASRT
jgi:enoyl-CoA hydratase